MLLTHFSRLMLDNLLFAINKSTPLLTLPLRFCSKINVVLDANWASMGGIWKAFHTDTMSPYFKHKC